MGSQSTGTRRTRSAPTTKNRKNTGHGALREGAPKTPIRHQGTHKDAHRKEVVGAAAQHQEIQRPSDRQMAEGHRCTPVKQNYGNKGRSIRGNTSIHTAAPQITPTGQQYKNRHVEQRHRRVDAHRKPVDGKCPLGCGEKDTRLHVLTCRESRPQRETLREKVEELINGASETKWNTFPLWFSGTSTATKGRWGGRDERWRKIEKFPKRLGNMGFIPKDLLGFMKQHKRWKPGTNIEGLIGKMQRLRLETMKDRWTRAARSNDKRAASRRMTPRRASRIRGVGENRMRSPSGPSRRSPAADPSWTGGHPARSAPKPLFRRARRCAWALVPTAKPSQAKPRHQPRSP